MEFYLTLVLAFIQLILILFVIFFEYKKGSISIFLWAMLLIMVGFGNIKGIYYKNYDYYVYIKATLFGIFFILFYLFTRSLQKTKNVIEKLRKTINTPRKIKKNYINFIYLLYLFIFIVYVKQNFGSLFLTSWGGFMRIKGNIYNTESILQFLYIYLNPIILFSPGILCIYLYKKKYFKFFIWFLIFLFPVIITRNRSDILPIAVSIIIFLLIKTKKVTFKLLMIYTFACCFMIIFLDIFRLFRFYGSISNFVERFNINEFFYKYLEMYSSQNGEIDLIDAFYYFISKNGEFIGFNTLATYRRILLILIPTKFSFGLKPFDFAITMGSAYINNFSNKTYSMHPTLFGDCYANFNYFGVLLGIFWGIFVKFIDKICFFYNNYMNIFLSVIWGYAYIVIGRGSVYNGIVKSLKATIILLILQFIFTKIRRSKNTIAID